MGGGGGEREGGREREAWRGEGVRRDIKAREESTRAERGGGCE